MRVCDGSMCDMRNPVSIAQNSTTIPKCEIVPLVHEDTELSLIFNLNKLLTAIGREGDVELHCRWSSGSMAEESVAIVD